MAEVLLEAESKLGVMLADIDKKQSYEGLTSTGGRKPETNTRYRGSFKRDSRYFTRGNEKAGSLYSQDNSS